MATAVVTPRCCGPAREVVPERLTLSVSPSRCRPRPARPPGRRLPVDADLPRDACDLRWRTTTADDHAVDGFPDAQELALDWLALFHLQRHLLRGKLPSATALMTRATSVVG